MAIRTGYLNFDGTWLQDQYIRVHEVMLAKDRMHVLIGVFLDKPAAEEAPHTIEPVRELPFDLLSDKNVWQQAYDGIKVHFPHAIDC